MEQTLAVQGTSVGGSWGCTDHPRSLMMWTTTPPFSQVQFGHAHIIHSQLTNQVMSTSRRACICPKECEHWASVCRTTQSTCPKHGQPNQHVLGSILNRWIHFSPSVRTPSFDTSHLCEPIRLRRFCRRPALPDYNSIL